MFDSSVTWAILLWESRTHLERGEQPWLLLCRARNLGQEGSGDPNLRSVQWLAYDPKQNSPLGAPHRGQRGSSVEPQHQEVHPTHLRSGSVLHVEYWSVAPVHSGTSSGQLNARTPDRHVLVEVVEARAPENWTDDVPHELRLEASWRGTEIPFHRGKRRKRRRVYLVHDEEGRPSWQRAEAMRDEQVRLFGGVKGHSPHSSDTGPTGAPEYAEGDVYSCEAPINDLLFRRYQQEAVLASRLNDHQNPVLFEITRSEDENFSKARSVPRMERLIAPGIPYVAQALRLDDLVLSRLGLRR